MMLLTRHISFKSPLMFLSPLGERLGEGVMQDETMRARELRRFWANHVVQNPEGIWAEIEQVVSIPLTQPLPQGGEETDMK